MKCLNPMEIHFNNLPILLSVLQQHRFEDAVVKMEYGSYAETGNLYAGLRLAKAFLAMLNECYAKCINTANLSFESIF